MADETVYKAHVRKPGEGLNVPAVLLIAAGVFLLVANLARFNLMSVLWPGFILGPGLLLLWPAYRSTAEEPSSVAFLAIPGALLMALAALFFVMNLSGHWESWAYAWTLLPAAVVAGLMYARRFDRSSRVHESGYRIIRALVLAFMALAVFFELFVFRGLGAWWPVLLIGAGFYLFVKEQRSK
jgi:hypothetical protein